MEDVTTTLSLVIEEFYTDIQKMIKSEEEICKGVLSRMTVDQTCSFMEKYGICTHQQYFLLVSEMFLHFNGKYRRTHYIVDAINSDRDFRQMGFYWADVHRHVTYRHLKGIEDYSQELQPVIQKVLSMRTEGPNRYELFLLTLGWMMWIYHTNQLVKVIGGNSGHGGYAYYTNALYFSSVPYVMKRHIKMFKEALITDLNEMSDEDITQWQYAAKRVFKNIEEYNQLMFEGITR